MIIEIFGALSIAIWVYLIFARGRFWRVSREMFLPDTRAVGADSVVAVIPARNEAELIAQSVTSILQQDYAGELHIFIVDDHSSDETASIAIAAAAKAGKAESVSVISSAALPGGWTGKLWAVHQGIQSASAFKPAYIWLTDADVVHGPTTLRKLVGKAREGRFDLVSLMVKLRSESTAERMLVPAFVFFFFKLYPPLWVASRRRKTAAAAGGCMLIGSDTLNRVGGISSIRSALIDDCALAREVKRVGAVWLGLTDESHSLRGNATWTDVGQMVSRTAFTQRNHSTRSEERVVGT